MSEITFYEDSVYPAKMSKLEPCDRSTLKLDFNSGSAISAAKRSHIMAGTPGNGALLQSPDLMLLKLGSPELENMIMQSNGFITTTPTPTDVRSSSKNTTEEQEQFAAGFVLALQKLQQSGEVKSTTVQDITAAYSDGSNVNKPVPSYNTPPYSSYDCNGNSVGLSIKQEAPERGIIVTAAPSYPQFTQSWNNQSRTKPILVRTNEPSNIRVQGQSSSRPVYSQESNITQRLRHPNDTQLSVVRHTQNKTGLAKQLPSTTNGSLPGNAASYSIQAKSLAAAPVITSVGSVMKLPPQPQILKIEDEAQIVPSNTPPLRSTPIDLKMQEIIKHERKKLRNRLAAQRCRKRKIEREDELKIKVKDLKTVNGDLHTTRSELRKLAIELKQKVMHHVNAGCHIYLPNSQANLSSECSPVSVS